MHLILRYLRLRQEYWEFESALGYLGYLLACVVLMRMRCPQLLGASVYCCDTPAWPIFFIVSTASSQAFVSET